MTQSNSYHLLRGTNTKSTTTIIFMVCSTLLIALGAAVILGESNHILFTTTYTRLLGWCNQGSWWTSHGKITLSSLTEHSTIVTEGIGTLSLQAMKSAAALCKPSTTSLFILYVSYAVIIVLSRNLLLSNFAAWFFLLGSCWAELFFISSFNHSSIDCFLPFIAFHPSFPHCVQVSE